MHDHQSECSHHQPAGEMKDPVCGMSVTPESEHRHEHEGQTWYFCSAGCKGKFAAHPMRYLAPQEDAAEDADPGAWYTCPMHPEVRQQGPGTCPKCGMALEPEAPSLEEEENPELVDFSRRFWISLPLSFAVFVLAAFAGNFEHFLAWVGMAFVPVAVMNGLALALGYTAGGVVRANPAERRAIAIEVGIQNSGLGLILVFDFFDGLGGMAVICAWWGIWHILSGLALSSLWRRRPPLPT